MIGLDSTPLLREAITPLEGRPLRSSLGNESFAQMEAEISDLKATITTLRRELLQRPTQMMKTSTL